MLACPAGLVLGATEVGHVRTTLEEKKDDLHEYRALPFLRGEYPEAVLQPVRLHVAAKRYLCATERHYFDSLSPA